MNDIEAEFRKVFGDMCLSDNDVALHIFELGYKAGAAAENESCAKACEAIYNDPNGNNGEDAYYTRPYLECAAAIRARMKND
jgi:hypothetical protein